MRETHPTHQELVQAADGELSARRIAKIQAHLATCAECRALHEQTSGAMDDFLRAYQRSINPQLPPAAGPRAVVRARMSGMAPALPSFWGRLAVAGMVLGAVAALALAVVSLPARRTPLAIPRSNLTPGAALAIDREQLCHADLPKNQPVPVSLRSQVFAAYGIPGADPQAYEVDYLITPALGGTDDVRNLWPQPYRSTVWNAAVKDALEDRLHDMVCHGDLDLVTAQHDISQNWIAAYKKYFHAESPLPGQ